VLVEDPLPVRQFYPDVPPALANLIDLGVRANPQERVAALFGVDPRQPRDMADTLRAAIAQAEDSLTMAELEREVPARHGDYLWLLDPPVGWPDEVLDFIADNWPEYGGEA
jgi:hypothetical protein